VSQELTQKMQEFLESRSEKCKQLTGPSWLLNLIYLKERNVKIQVLNLDEGSSEDITKLSICFMHLMSHKLQHYL
jgi:hypothetical protein